MPITTVPYGTADEIAFLRGLATGKGGANRADCDNGWCGKGKNEQAFWAYADLVLSGRRAYDDRVDVKRVKEEIVRLMGELRRVA